MENFVLDEDKIQQIEKQFNKICLPEEQNIKLNQKDIDYCLEHLEKEI